MDDRIFADRRVAGKALVEPLQALVGDASPLILGLPRGGVPLAWEVAEGLDADLDVLVVRKLGVPYHPELAMGAIASGGARVLNPQVINLSNITPEMIEQVEKRELAELQQREEMFRGDLPPPAVAGRTVVLVDDGLATGATMEAAVAALRSLQPARLVVAIPVASRDAVARLARQVDDVVCLLMPEYFQAVGQWYGNFDQVSDGEVRELLAARQKRGVS